jgi:hypothetical protein
LEREEERQVDRAEEKLRRKPTLKQQNNIEFKTKQTNQHQTKQYQSRQQTNLYFNKLPTNRSSTTIQNSKPESLSKCHSTLTRKLTFFQQQLKLRKPDKKTNINHTTNDSSSSHKSYSSTLIISSRALSSTPGSRADTCKIIRSITTQNFNSHLSYHLIFSSFLLTRTSHSHCQFSFSCSYVILIIVNFHLSFSFHSHYHHLSSFISLSLSSLISLILSFSSLISHPSSLIPHHIVFSFSFSFSSSYLSSSPCYCPITLTSSSVAHLAMSARMLLRALPPMFTQCSPSLRTKSSPIRRRPSTTNNSDNTKQ